MNRIIKRVQNKSATDILQSYSEELSYPIDIVGIASKFGFSVSGINFTELEKNDVFKDLVDSRGHILGAVYIDSEDAQILYNTELIDDGRFSGLSDEKKKENLRKRQRFTVAHEIAHCCLHMSSEETVHIEFRNDQANNTNAKEKAANIFAGELLMPTKIMVALGDVFNYRFPVNKLSELFFVSRNVVRARIQHLVDEGVFPKKTMLYEMVN